MLHKRGKRAAEESEEGSRCRGEQGRVKRAAAKGTAQERREGSR
jgi:hypothetical protein